MSRAFLFDLGLQNGRVSDPRFSRITLDDLPAPLEDPTGTWYGPFDVDRWGRITKSQGASAPPSTGGTTRVATVTTTTGNVGAGEDTIHTTTLTAGLLGTNGDALTGILGGEYNASGGDENYTITLKLDGNVLFSTGALGLSGTGWTMTFTIIRVDATTIRATVSLVASATSLSATEEFTVTLANALDLVVTAESAGATPANDDITINVGYVEKRSA